MDLCFEIVPQNITTPVESDIGPSLTVYQGKLFAAWKGGNGDQRMWYSTFDGTSWSQQQLFPEPFASTHGPTLVTFHNAIYAVWKGSGSDVGLWWSCFNGLTWNSQQRVGGHNSSNGAGLAVYRGVLYLAYQGAPGYAPEAIWWTSYDGTGWSDHPMTELVTSDRPALGVSGEGEEQKLVMVYKGNSTDQTIYYSTLDGASWAPKQPLGGMTTSAPSVANYRGQLYAVWKGTTEDDTIWYSTFNGSAWAAPKALRTHFPAGFGPSLAVLNEQLYVAWKGWDTKIWWVRTPPAGIAVQNTWGTVNVDVPPAAHPSTLLGNVPTDIATSAGTQSTMHGHSRRSSNSSSSSDDLRRLKRGVKKGVAELSQRFRSSMKGGK